MPRKLLVSNDKEETDNQYPGPTYILDSKIFFTDVEGIIFFIVIVLNMKTSLL